jgi:Tfp pilus assembly protein PilF
MQLGLPEAAAKDLKQALEIAPDFTMTATRLASLYLAQGWPLAEPERLLRRAVDKQPRSTAGLAMLVRLELRLGRLSQAQSNLDSVAELFVRLSASDTRTAATAQAVRQAVADAYQAGLTIPPALQQR